MTTKKMSVEEFIALPDNPIQRNTERHLQKAKHLLTPLPHHSHVAAAQLPGGRLIKLDGHTRALAWKRNIIPRPANLEVHIFEAKNMEEVAEFYKPFDSKDALETTPDKVSGALNGMGYTPQSGLIASGAFNEALRYAWNGIYGYGRELRWRDVYEAINEFAAEIIAVDELLLRKGQLPAGIISAIILSYRKHGDEVIPFWKAVIANAGQKSNGRMDGVQAVNELVLGRRGKGAGGSHALDILGRALSALEKYLADETLPGIPKPIELTSYVTSTGVRPKYKLIKKTPTRAQQVQAQIAAAE